jgi:hypothetical protein
MDSRLISTIQAGVVGRAAPRTSASIAPVGRMHTLVRDTYVSAAPRVPLPVEIEALPGVLAGVQRILASVQLLLRNVQRPLRDVALPAPSVALPALPPVAPPVPPAPPAPPPPPVPAPVAPVPAPVVRPAPTLKLSGLEEGKGLRVAPGTKFTGMDIQGSGRVKTLADDTLEVTLALKAGFIGADVGLRATLRPDGKLAFVAGKLDGKTREIDPMLDEVYDIVSLQPGELRFRTAEGKDGLIRTDGLGGLTLEHPRGSLTLLGG